MKIFSYIVYGLLWVLSYLPFGFLYLMSDINYFFVYHVFRYRRKVVRRNLCNAFPEKQEKEIVRIEKKFYAHLMDLSLELYKMWHISTKQMRKRCVFKNPEFLEKYYVEGRSVIAIIGHYGNWEYLSSFPLWGGDVDFLVLYKPLRNRLFDRMTRKIRSRFGVVPVPKDETLRVMSRYREEQRLFITGFIGDQTPNAQNLNFWTDFLNQDTPVLLGTEKIARKYNYPVVFLKLQKKKRGYYVAEFIELCPEPLATAPGEITVMHTRMLEEIIREEPAYWLWSHKRWKHRRVTGKNKI